MKLNEKFYEPYTLPIVNDTASKTVRRHLLEIIETPASYKITEESVRFFLNNPILRSQEQRRIGKISMLKTIQDDYKRKGSFQTNDQIKLKIPSKIMPDLNRMTVSEKKFKKENRVFDLENVIEFAKNRKISTSTDLDQDIQEKLRHNKKLNIREEKKKKLRKAVNYVTNIGIARRNVIRDPYCRSLIKTALLLNSDISEKNKHQYQPYSGLKSSYQINEGSSRNLAQSAVSNDDLRKKRRRNTVAATAGKNAFINALQELALAPIRANL